MLKNPDGSPFQLSDLQNYDRDNPEFELINDWDKEVIEIGGSPIFYYEVMIQANTIDPLYLEDRGKLWNPNPVCLHAIYDPVPSQNYMTTFGIDAPDEVMFEFNYRDVIEKLGHPPRIGSRIFTPHRRENWQIAQIGDEQYQLWGQTRLQVMCKKFQETLTTADGKATAKSPDDV